MLTSWGACSSLLHGRTPTGDTSGVLPVSFIACKMGGGLGSWKSIAKRLSIIDELPGDRQLKLKRQEQVLGDFDPGSICAGCVDVRLKRAHHESVRFNGWCDEEVTVWVSELWGDWEVPEEGGLEDDELVCDWSEQDIMGERGRMLNCLKPDEVEHFWQCSHLPYYVRAQGCIGWEEGLGLSQ